MKRFLFIIGILLLAIQVVAQAQDATAVTQPTRKFVVSHWNVDGVKREALVYVPASFDSDRNYVDSGRLVCS